MKDKHHGLIFWHDSSHFKKQTWKNGKGETLELLRLNNEAGEFFFRLSIATVTSSGTFSNFAGYERHLLLLPPTRITLDRADGSLTEMAEPLIIVKFPGEEDITYTVQQAGFDFNVMTLRDTARSEVEILYAKAGSRIILPEGSFLYQLSGDLSYEHSVIKAEILWKTKQQIEIKSVTDSTSILIRVILIDNKQKAF